MDHQDKTAEAGYWISRASAAVRAHELAQNEHGEAAAVAIAKYAHEQLGGMLRDPGDTPFPSYALLAETLIPLTAWFNGVDGSEDTANRLDEIASGAALEEALEKGA